MASKTNYTSPQGLFKAAPTDIEGVFNLYKVTSAQLIFMGTLDAGLGKYTQKTIDESMSTSSVRDLSYFMAAMQEKFDE